MSYACSFRRGLTHKAVYWNNPVSDGEGGRTFGTPVEIACRWEDKTELFIDDTGQEVASRSVVYVATDVVAGGYLFRGELTDLGSGEDADPMSNDMTFEIRGTTKSGDMRGSGSLGKVWL